MPLSEFTLIEKYFTRQPVARPDVALGVGDDCALLNVPQGQSLAVSIDTLVEGVHFLADTPPCDLGWRALAVNLSDLAAMGAQPAWATLALTLPRADEAWLAEFSAGFFELAQLHDVQLVGGNMARGSLNVTVQVHGFVPAAQALRRDAARAGDLIFVTGTLGDAALGLRVARGEFVPPRTDAVELLYRYRRPVPRIAAGLALRGVAHACIDISDGFLADLGHVLDASAVGAQVRVDQLPRSSASRHIAPDELALALHGGDDYELCFTVPPEHRAQVEQIFTTLDCAATCVGTVEPQRGIRCVDARGGIQDVTPRGYDHFAGE